jgi:hypothetical protein
MEGGAPMIVQLKLEDLRCRSTSSLIWAMSRCGRPAIFHDLDGLGQDPARPGRAPGEDPHGFALGREAPDDVPPVVAGAAQDEYRLPLVHQRPFPCRRRPPLSETPCPPQSFHHHHFSRSGSGRAVLAK